jgi:hypothetical protein
LAKAWQRLSPHFLNYVDVGDALLEVDRELSGGRYQQAILNNFRWREIGTVNIGPRLSVPDAQSHVFSTRTLTPEHELPIPRLSFRERWARAGKPATRGMQPIGGGYHG